MTDPVNLRRPRVCIYGGTALKPTPTEFISTLAFEMLDSMSAMIVTGGFSHSNEKPAAVSTDRAALEGARQYVAVTGASLKDCYEAWIPEPELDRRPDVGGVVRMTEAEGITVRVMKGRTPLGRRLALAAGVDLVITISGREHTEVVVEQALELGVPVLPIPDAGGDSEELLGRHRARIAAAFDPGALDKCLQDVKNTIQTAPKAAARAVVELAKTAKVGKCLVLLPYDDEHERLWSQSIAPAVARHMIPVRLDHLPKSEAIYTSFADAMRSSSAVIADITEINENVMYEVGYAHGQGLTPLICARDAARLDNLPVYFRTLNVRLASAAMPLEALIDDYLRSVKDARRSQRLGASTG